MATRKSTQLMKLDEVLSVKTIKLFDRKSERSKNPVVRAHHVWGIVSDQLSDILGQEIHGQWFAKVRPLVISENVLILETHNNLAGLWINKHYQQLVDLLLQFIDEKLSCFFLKPSDSKSSTTKIDSQTKNKNSDKSTPNNN